MTILARWRPTRWTAGVARLAIVVALLAGCGEAPGTPAASTSAPTASVAGPSPTAQACRPVEAPASTNEWRERTFYELFVRSFADADGDGIGDIAGLTAKLDYLNDGDAGTTDDLGISGIWLMPVAEASSYHGYDVTDYEAVESDYGTIDELRAFVDAAHQRGIAVIVDFVPNHTSSEHPWFRDALRGGDHREWYVWSDEDPGWPPVAGPNPWHAAPDGSAFYYGAFSDRMPDLNLANPEVTAELERIAAFWLVEVGVDGFRIDAAKHLVEEGPAAQTNTATSHRWLEAFREAIAAIKPDALVVGEVFDVTRASSSYVPRAVDATFDFELAGKLLLGVQAEDGPTIAAAQAETLSAYGSGLYGAFLTNHDQPRVMEQLTRPTRARVAASLLLTNPGLPFVFYGEELGLTGGKPDERIRSPMPWDGSAAAAGFTTGTPWEALEDGWETANVATEAADPESLLSHYRELIRIRRDHPALASGTHLPLLASEPAVYAFLAVGRDEIVAVVINLADEAVTEYELSLAGGVCELGPVSVIDGDGDGGLEPVPPVPDPSGGFEGWRPVTSLPPYSTLVLGFEPVSP